MCQCTCAKCIVTAGADSLESLVVLDLDLRNAFLHWNGVVLPLRLPNAHLLLAYGRVGANMSRQTLYFLMGNGRPATWGGGGEQRVSCLTGVLRAGAPGLRSCRQASGGGPGRMVH